MDLLTELMEIVHINFDIGSTSWIDVTHINNPHSFYVRSTSLSVYMPTIEAPGEKATISDLQLEPNIIYYSKILHSHCRGKILRVNDDKTYCDIFAIDFGCIEKTIFLSDVYKPKHKINIPPLAFHCRLANCQPKTDVWTHKEIDAMKFFIGDEEAKMIVKEKSNDQLIVELKNSCPDDIATMLAATGYTTCGYTVNQIPRVPKSSKEIHYYLKEN